MAGHVAYTAPVRADVPRTWGMLEVFRHLLSESKFNDGVAICNYYQYKFTERERERGFRKQNTKQICEISPVA